MDWLERRRRRTRRFATRKEAESFIGALADGSRRASSDRLDLATWFVQWVTTTGLEWEPRTRRDRAWYADRWIVPHLGRLRLAEIGRSDVRDWRAEIVAQGASAYTANKAVAVLSAYLSVAVDDELISANPCRGLKPLKRRNVQRRRPATLSEVEGIRLRRSTILQGTRPRATILTSPGTGR